ncbi:uncharacterized protein LOC123266277 [Cotesia glomerata]|uniref:Major facilitator superfamily (MFS) profile domain-containing protein n=1 Tax=Cotesia glomerata TaxID=32391 RepID=A0AAV7IWV7_COTGL|nr:uncharacterized protein LOC123266277 [Cotesia glomerata]KAH0560185.1 hypothetical protein KQX54_002327 [Cotesia glomerata]
MSDDRLNSNYITTESKLTNLLEREMKTVVSNVNNNNNNIHDINNTKSNNVDSCNKIKSKSRGSCLDSPKKGPAPLVGWQNDSPTVCTTSPNTNTNNSFNSTQDDKDNDFGSRKSSGIGRDSSLALTNDHSSIDTISSHKNESECESESLLTPSGDPFPNKQSNQEKNDQADGDGMVNFSAESSVVDLVFDLKKNLGRNATSIDLDSCNEDPKIPDGGWGWMVVLASLVISLIADGVSFSFGLLYIEFLNEFRASKSKTAWIGSLFMAVPLMSGPVMSALVDRYGCRKMTILGGLISGFGFTLSSFGTSIEFMFLTFGILSGLGLGLCYVTAVVSIAYWFDKKRTLAMGLGACGTGIGTFVYAPLTSFWIFEYGWRGTCLLLGGTFLNLIVCGCVMRDPEWWVIEQRKQSIESPRKSIVRSENGRSCSAISVEDFPGIEELRKLLKSGKTPECQLQSLRTSLVTPCDGTLGSEGGSGFRSVVNLPTFVRQSEKVPLEVLESLSTNSRLYNVILENYPSLLLCRSISDKNVDQSPTGETSNKAGVTMSMRIKQAKEKNAVIKAEDAPGFECPIDMTKVQTLKVKTDFEKTVEQEKSKHHTPGINCDIVRTDSLPWLRRQFNPNTHYFKNIRVHRNSVMYRGAVLNLHKYRLRASSCPDIFRNSMTTLAKENEEKWYSEIVSLFKDIMDFSMFLELHFLALSLSTITLFTWFIVPYFYLAEHLTRNGYSEADGAHLLSIIGISSTIGMVFLGWAGDQPWMNRTKTYAVCLIGCGIATIFMSTFVHNYTILMVSAAFFGLLFSSNLSFTPVIVVELIPLERFTTAYGLSLLCQGIGNFVGPPFAGLLFDLTNTWDLSFLQAGGWIIVSGLLVGIIPYTKNRKIWGSGLIEMEQYA